ncbi:uncharacterized protein LOC131152725 [Malania oleifera]|uniref:uncharacterized protein LOC131152725 n=1 Tax=Malania oleifera TaxID=397392 RepID=UPI0025ADC52D|nr:uncharacterized protein LOC131152725 [Malania oleifera]XP_057960540.1 uncharacterized protein LOC131152725 [Malania oleifera]XP_057960541.1 uncharacterized protein LOC131152725 [Malania oleifera]
MMQMQRERRNDEHHYQYQSLYSDRVANRDNGTSMPSKPHSLTGGDGCGVGFIEHPVSKMDTLAGIAIKYGVEVADIKKMNGLVTDLQMFALKSLHIPTPGRHPPSPCLSSDCDTPGRSCFDQTPRRHSDLFDSFQSLRMKSPQQVSPAMSSLQGYYGLKTNQKSPSDGFELAVYRRGSAHYLEDEVLPKASMASNPPLGRHRKSRSVANGFLTENGELIDDVHMAEAREGDSDKWNEKLVRRRQKSEADFSSHAPEMLLKEDNSSGGGFSAIAGKGLALRPKAAGRTSLAGEMDAGWSNLVPIGIGDSSVADGFTGVRKSSSTSSLQDQDSSSSLSIWPTSKWSLKSDLQALSNTAIARPIFDGLPKPITGRKNKAALD